MEEWKIKILECMDVMEKDAIKARRNYWINRRMKKEQERRDKLRESHLEGNEGDTSTGEEWEIEDW